MTVPLAPPQRPQVSYLPGAWLAFVAADVLLLAEIPISGPLAIACWDRINQGSGVDGVLGVIGADGLRAVPNFALVGPSGDGGTRLVVSGKARAEVLAPGQTEPANISAAESTTAQEQRVAGHPAIRLFAETGDNWTSSALPLIAGVVQASVLAAGMPAAPPARTATPAPAAPPGVSAPAYPAEAVAVPVAPPTQALPVESVSSDTMPPRSDFDSGLIDSLPWRTPETFLGEPTHAEAPSEPPPAVPEPQPEEPSWPDAGWPQSGGQMPWPDAGVQNPWADTSGQAPWRSPRPATRPGRRPTNRGHRHRPSSRHRRPTRGHPVRRPRQPPTSSRPRCPTPATSRRRTGRSCRSCRSFKR